MKDRLLNLLLILISICCVCALEYTKNEIESCLEEAEATARNYVLPQDYGFRISSTKISPHISCDYVIVGASDSGIVAAVKLRQKLPNAKICLINTGSITLNNTLLTKVPGFKKYLSRMPGASIGLKSAPSTNFFLGYKRGQIKISSSKLGGGYSAINSMTFGKPTSSEMTTFKEIIDKLKVGNIGGKNSGLLGSILGGSLLEGGLLGSLLGGSSSLSAEDLLNWVLGLEEDMKLLESSSIPNADPRCHGSNGLFPTSLNTYVGKAAKEFIKNGGDQIDYNCHEGVGCSNMQVTISNSIRYTSVDAFLQDSDITIISNAFVSKINIAQTDSGTFAATGIEYVQNNILYSLDVTKEVILSAGVIHTPKILQHSGIGDCEELENLNIPCQKHLPDVGKAQRARPKVRLLVKTNCTESTYISNEVIEEYIQYGTGLLSNAGNLGGICFLHTKNPDSPHPNFQFNIKYVNCSDQVLNLKDDIANEWCNNSRYPDGAIMITIIPINYKSTVSTTLKSSKISDFPKIKYNFHQQDQNKLAEAITYLKNNIGRFFTECSAKLDVQIPSIEDPNKSEFENNLNFVKYTASFSSQLTGGCDIGKVIDSKMKVIGSCNLRVCDSSSLPMSSSRNPSSLLMAMGGQLVDFITQN